ncbi:MAG TPA: hypothetical protein VHN37_12695 [Actinomycetota bacterium]|nr:hypothetical protein [Actinomycetota bacterium]
MPHAPLLLPEVAGPKNEVATARVRDAVRGIDFGERVVVVASPHGTRTGVYARAAGSLDAFGPRGVDVSWPEDPVARPLAAAWGAPVLDEPVDHGIVVPLRLLRASSVVAVAFEEGEGDGEGLARALASIEHSFAFVASANLSAGHGERAPLPSVEDAAAVDGRVLRSLQIDPGALVEQGTALRGAGSCGAAPLAAFGALFADRSCDVTAYEHPFGVGYAVALTP